MLPKSYDVVGNIAILKFPKETKKARKVKIAKQLLKQRKSVETVLEKSDKVSGRLRTIKATHLAGEKNKEASYLENNCKFKFNVETCYFSPRLSNERKEVADQIRKGERVLVLFAGVGPFSIIIGKNSSAKEVVSVELGKECSKYALNNVQWNKLDNVKVIQGDVKKLAGKISGKFDRIVMPRPNLKDTFLSYALKFAKKGTIVNYYGFGKDKNDIVDEIKKDVKKIKIIKVKKAGETAPYKYRWRVDFKVL